MLRKRLKGDEEGEQDEDEVGKQKKGGKSKGKPISTSIW